MKVILLSTGGAQDFSGFLSKLAPPMVDFLGRPFLQHVLELLARLGFDEFDFVCSQNPESIRSVFNDGTRWGVSCKYHLARDPERIIPQLKSFSSASDEPVWIFFCDRITLFPSDIGKDFIKNAMSEDVWLWTQSDQGPVMAGLCCFRFAFLSTLVSDFTMGEGMKKI